MVAFVRDPKGGLPLECVNESRFPGFVLPDDAVKSDAAPATR